MPYDVISPKLGLTPNAHRLAALGHGPLLGLVFGVGDILSGTCTFIDKSGKWRVIDVPGHEGSSNVLEAMVKVVVHGFSDVFTERGLPPPFLTAFQLVGAKSGFTLREGGDPVPVRDVGAVHVQQRLRPSALRDDEDLARGRRGHPMGVPRDSVPRGGWSPAKLESRTD